MHPEQEFAAELQALAEVDGKQRPPRWKLSPWAVKTHLLGGTLENGFEVTPKYIGSERLIEIAIATLATDRALLLYGLPGTAKSWVSEHLELDRSDCERPCARPTDLAGIRPDGHQGAR